jgi:hypothetical protein
MSGCTRAFALAGVRMGWSNVPGFVSFPFGAT